MKSDGGGVWEMQRLVEEAVDIPVDDTNHCKYRSMVEEGGNKDLWALEVVVKSPGDSLLLSDSPPHRGV